MRTTNALPYMRGFALRYDMRDGTDWLWYAAIAALPVDGTRLGGYMPYWTPISPWLFMAYVVLNSGLLPVVYRRYRIFFIYPAALLLLSLTGWILVGFHPLSVAESLLGVFGVLACLSSIEIAVMIKGLNWRCAVRLLIGVYWIALGVGLVQRLALSFDLEFLKSYFKNLMMRDYITGNPPWQPGRPQFLFAEPSYIGMHLYGVLLPVMWLVRTRDSVYAKRLMHLIVAFAACSVVFGAGLRIVIDSIVAFVLATMAYGRRDADDRRKCYMAVGVVFVTGLVGILVFHKRLGLMMERGIFYDGSTAARVWQSLGPLLGLVRHPWELFIGAGAGNIVDAAYQGKTDLLQVLRSWGLTVKTAEQWYGTLTPGNMSTMSAYTSFVAEYGLIGLALLVVVVIGYITRHRRWNLMLVCWLVLIGYLYVQFEGYAFYAIPLFFWGCTRVERERTAFPAGA